MVDLIGELVELDIDEWIQTYKKSPATVLFLDPHADEKRRTVRLPGNDSTLEFHYICDSEIDVSSVCLSKERAVLIVVKAGFTFYVDEFLENLTLAMVYKEEYPYADVYLMTCDCASSR